MAERRRIEELAEFPPIIYPPNNPNAEMVAKIQGQAVDSGAPFAWLPRPPACSCGWSTADTDDEIAWRRYHWHRITTHP